MNTTMTKTKIQELNEFRRSQIKILKDFCIELTPQQKMHINSLTSEIAIENYKRKLLGIEYNPTRCTEGSAKHHRRIHK